MLRESGGREEKEDKRRQWIKNRKRDVSYYFTQGPKMDDPLPEREGSKD